MARDRIHEAVKNALIKDGWTITHDPYPIQYDDVDGYADLGAERLIAASRDSEKIIVEVKSFIGRSIMRDFQQSLGQYLVYKHLLELYESTVRMNEFVDSSMANVRKAKWPPSVF